MKIIGILVVYTQETRAKVVAEFESFVESLGETYEVHIVNNGSNIAEGDLVGDNSNQEFSAWNVGLTSVNIAEGDFVVFANDTFCIRHGWGVIKRRRFRSALKRASVLESPSMIGAVSKYNGSYEIFGHAADFWIQTDIFILSGSALEGLKGIGLSAEILNPAVSENDNGGFEWGGGVSQSLISRIENWLMPKAGEFGWYRAGVTDISSKIRKAKTILNEKWLSAYMVNSGVLIIDAGPGLIIKTLKRANTKFRQLVLKK